MKFIGCGTGRCGTQSLAELINGCEGWKCTHELKPLLPWDVDLLLLKDRVDYFNNHDRIGDVAFYYLPYLEKMIEDINELRVVGLKRDMEETVRSYMEKTSERNHWINHDGSYWRKDRRWDDTYPSYDLPKGESKEERKRKALREYWHDYYNYLEYLSDGYNEVKIYPMDVLNEESLQRDMFDFIGIEEPNLQVGLKLNESK